MLLYLLLTTLSRTFIIKGNFNNGRNPPSCPFPDIAFINEEVTGCINEKKTKNTGAINETAIAIIIVPRNLPSCFLFHVLLIQLQRQSIDQIFILILRF